MMSGFTYFCRFRVHMVYTSDKVQGQVFIPVANWSREHPFLQYNPSSTLYPVMIATVVIVAAFNNSTQLTNAYGFAVATVMFTTTVLISLQIRYVKQLPYILGVLFLLFFGFLDGKVISHPICCQC